MQKFKLVGLVGLGLILGVMGFWVVSNNKLNETYEDTPVLENKELLSMMLETEAGSGKYQETTASSWPTDGYTFNETLSKCENGGTLSWDSTNKKVIMEGNSSDKCYVYFDVYIPPRYDESCDESTLACHVAKQYTGTQGENNMYLHDSTLENGANDDSYRYAGSSETTDNFVCFGYDSQNGTCPTDYLYRIIGVFDNQVKLIKYDYAKSSLLGTDGDYYKTYAGAGESGTNKGSNTTSEIGAYYWNYNTYNNTWSGSKLNTVNLNTNYPNNIGSKWSEKIATHTWIVGGNTLSNIGYVPVSTVYTNEITSPATNKTYEAKIGLMYVSDYGYAATLSAWTTLLVSYSSSSITSVNWMYMGLLEWTLVPQADDHYTSFKVSNSGGLSNDYVNVRGFAARPVFYLNSDITYVSGLGTLLSPIIIN